MSNNFIFYSDSDTETDTEIELEDNESSISDNDSILVYDKFLNSIENYKIEIQKRVIPNDENGISQTLDPLKNYEKILKNDNESLLNGSDEISEEAKKHLLQYFTQENTYSDLINFLSILTLNLVIYPYSLDPEHSNKLKNNNQ